MWNVENEICFAFDRVHGQTGHSEKFYQEKCDALVAARDLYKENDDAQDFICLIQAIIAHFRKNKSFYKKHEERKKIFEGHPDLKEFKIKNYWKSK